MAGKEIKEKMDKSENKFAEKMNEYIKKTGKKITDLAKETGIAYTSLNSYIKEGRQPTFKAVDQLIRKADISPEWLFLDQGKMLMSEELKDRKQRYFVEFLFENFGIDYEEDLDEIQTILKQLHNAELRKQVAKFLKVFDPNTDKNKASNLINEMIKFLVHTNSVLSILRK